MFTADLNINILMAILLATVLSTGSAVALAEQSPVSVPSWGQAHTMEQLASSDSDSKTKFNPFAKKAYQATHSRSAQARFEDLSEDDVPSVEEYEQSIINKIDRAKQQMAVLDQPNTKDSEAMAPRSVGAIKTKPRTTNKNIAPILIRDKALSEQALRKYNYAPSEFRPVNEAQLLPQTSNKKVQPKRAQQTPNKTVKVKRTPKVAPKKVDKKSSKRSDQELADQLNQQNLAPIQNTVEQPAAVKTINVDSIKKSPQTNVDSIKKAPQTTLPAVEKLSIEKAPMLKVEPVEKAAKSMRNKGLDEEALADKLTEENIDINKPATNVTNAIERIPSKIVKPQSTTSTYLQQNFQDTRAKINDSKQTVNKQLPQIPAVLPPSSYRSEAQRNKPTEYQRKGIIENFNDVPQVDPAVSDGIILKDDNVIAGKEAKILSVEDAKKAIQQQQQQP